MATVAHNHFGMFNIFGPKAATVPTVEIPQLSGAKMTIIADERVDVMVGLNSKARIWRLHKDLLTQFSGYFAGVSKAGTEEARVGKFILSNQDPAAFQLFIQWLYSTNKDITIGAPSAELDSADPWVQHADKAYELGQVLQCPKFSRYALVKFAQGIRFMNPATLLHIYHDGNSNKLKHNCPLRRFNAAWLWYVRHTHALLWSGVVSTWWIGDGDLADPVCGPLVKRMLKDKAFDHHGHSGLLDKAVDPHWLNLDHWYEGCSAKPLRLNCSHVPFPCNTNGWGQKWE